MRSAGNVSPLLAKPLVLFGSLVIGLVMVEAGLRLFGGGFLAEPEDERTLAYRYDAQLGWFPIANSRGTVTASRTVSIAHNRLGFRGPEFVKTNKPAMVFLGDSFVWGFDVEASERFTERLQEKHPEWAIYNLGVSGYGTDQEYLLLQKCFDAFQPRVVVLIVCGDNDNEDNAWNCRGGYYKPYYTLAGGGLKLHGVPVPKSARTFLAEHPRLRRCYLARLVVRTYYRFAAPPPTRNADPPTGVLLLELRRYALGKGAQFAIGLTQAHAGLEKFLQDYGIPYADLTTTNPADRYPKFGNHWTPAGHAFVAEKLDDFLKNN